MDEGLSQLAAYGSDGSDSEDEEPPPARASRGVSWASDGALADVVRCPHSLAAGRPDGWPCVCVCVLCPLASPGPRSSLDAPALDSASRAPATFATARFAAEAD